MTSYAQTTQLADLLGSKLIGFNSSNVYDKLQGLPVSVTEYGAVGDGVTNDAPAIQAAINSGKQVIVIDASVGVATDITLHSDQTLRFIGAGKIVVTAGAIITNGVLYSNAGTNITIIDPVIDASAVAGGCTGLKFTDVIGAHISNGKFTRANLYLESSDNTVERRISVTDLSIDMSGRSATTIYLSGIRGVTVRGGEIYGGLEGVGIYNAARNIRISEVVSHNHTQDGFIVNAGQDVVHVACYAYSNGQSGFTTQRTGAGTDTLRVAYVGCESAFNAYDGFDLRGKVSAPAWGIETRFVATGCISRANTRTGFYIVLAEGTTLDACTAELNLQQGLFVDTSDRAIVTGFRSISNAAAVASGNNKAGILAYNSNGAQISAPISGNNEGATQDFGVSFTGTSVGGRVVGGDLTNNNNATVSFVLGSNTIIGSRAIAPAGVVFKSVDDNGIYEDTCTGAPSHTRTKGSRCIRTDGGSSENYFSNGGGSWVKYIPGQAAITSPTGGTTIDTQARTAIDAIRTTLSAAGVTV